MDKKIESVASNVRIEKKGISYNLNLKDKISDLIEIITKDEEENINIKQKFIVDINLQDEIKIKINSKDDFLFGKTDYDDKIHPYFQNSLRGNNLKNTNIECSEKSKILLEFEKKDKIFLFSPHQDDEILGASSLLYKSFKEKLDIKVIYLTSGKGGGDENERKKEAINGINQLGGKIDNLIFMNLPFYSKKDRIVSEEDYNFVLKIIEENKPNIIFICADVFDPNGTHKKCYEVLIQIYYSGIFKDIKFYFYYSVWYWPKQNEYSHILNYDFESYKLKVYAMLEHKSQLENKFMGGDFRPFYQRACTRDLFYGNINGGSYCEVYYLLN
jgi:LmbE family N-acetylglucosaminyl deacetylase